eukprot:COSAG04_NODE_8064_length_1028_cov_1.441335_1_plen_137_part_10
MSPSCFSTGESQVLRFFRLLALTVRILTHRLCRCAEEALPKIAQQGFLRSKQTSAAGAWQRFGEPDARRPLSLRFCLTATEDPEPRGLWRRAGLLLCAAGLQVARVPAARDAGPAARHAQPLDAALQGGQGQGLQDR